MRYTNNSHWRLGSQTLTTADLGFITSDKHTQRHTSAHHTDAHAERHSRPALYNSLKRNTVKCSLTQKDKSWVKYHLTAWEFRQKLGIWIICKKKNNNNNWFNKIRMNIKSSSITNNYYQLCIYLNIDFCMNELSDFLENLHMLYVWCVWVVHKK